jgi:hypothetical protein
MRSETSVKLVALRARPAIQVLRPMMSAIK